MTLKAEVSIPVGLATCTLVYGIYQLAGPSLADQRMVPPGSAEESTLASTERTALFASATAAAAVSLISRDPIPFVLGGSLAVALSWFARHSRAVDPSSGRLPGMGPREVALTAQV